MIISKNAVKSLLSLAIILSVAFFFYKAFQSNWTSIHSHKFQINYLFLFLSFSAMLVTYLLSTYGWYMAINSLSDRARVTFPQSIAAVNASNLAKYLPGKIWSYALQMYWLVNAGFSKSLILYVNMINFFFSIITSVITGLVYLLFSSTKFPFAAILSLLLALVVLDICCVAFNAAIFNSALSLVNKMFKRDIRYFDISKKLMIDLHVIHFAAAFIFGVGAYLLCFGIGYHVEPDKILMVMSSLLISDVIGFLAIIVPAGLGVREGVMYLILGGATPGSLSLILPVASRIVNMLADIFLGAIALRLLKNYINTDWAGNSP
jgi:uncharacterized membrane protein YbhN (UPF0104 family)